jgi:hypothetical protein
MTFKPTTTVQETATNCDHESDFNEPVRPIINIQTLGPDCGGGKTRGTIRWVIGKAATIGQCCIVSQPTTYLMDQTLGEAEEFRAEFDPLHPIQRVIIKVIHGDNKTGTSVKGDILNFLRGHKASDGAFVLLITHAALLALDWIPNNAKIYAVVDEAPTANYSEELAIGEHRHYLVDNVDVLDAGPSYVQLAVKNRDLYKKIKRNKHEDVLYEHMRGFAEKITSPHWIVMVNAAEWHRFVNGKQSKLNVHGLLQPTFLQGYKGVLMLGAHIEQSISYRYWSNLAEGPEVRLIPCKLPRNPRFGFGIIPNCIETRFMRYPNSHLVDLLYLQDRDNSRTVRMTKVDGETIENHNAKRVRGFFEKRDAGKDPEDCKIAYMANKDSKIDLPGAVQIPNTPHGNNSFKHIHNIVVFSASLPTTSHYHFMSEFAHINSEELRDAIDFAIHSQTIARGSLRDPDNSDRKTIIVASKSMADRLHKALPKSNPPRKIEGADVAGFGKKRAQNKLFETSARKNAAYKKAKRERLLNELNNLRDRESCRRRLVHKTSYGAGVLDRIETSITHAPPSNRPGILARSGNLYRNKRSRIPCESTAHLTNEDLIQIFRSLQDEVYESKDDNWLMSAAEMDPDLSDETDRGNANVVSLRGVWMDNDGGGISHQEFAELFPRLRMVVYNTHSSHNDCLRYRVWIPTTQAISVDVHAELISQIFARLTRAKWRTAEAIVKLPAGHGCRPHGFDMGKLNAASLFFLPCRAAAGAEHSFFIEYNTDVGREIDPVRWVTHTTIDHRPEPEVIIVPSAQADDETTTDRTRKCEAVLAKFAQDNRGYAKFAPAVWSLLHIHDGDRYAADPYIRRAVSMARTPEERARDLERVIKKYDPRKMSS